MTSRLGYLLQTFFSKQSSHLNIQSVPTLLVFINKQPILFFSASDFVNVLGNSSMLSSLSALFIYVELHHTICAKQIQNQTFQRSYVSNLICCNVFYFSYSCFISRSYSFFLFPFGQLSLFSAITTITLRSDIH